jgi:Ca2+-binding EF-hand superfamily protein
MGRGGAVALTLLGDSCGAFRDIDSTRVPTPQFVLRHVWVALLSMFQQRVSEKGHGELSSLTHAVRELSLGGATPLQHVEQQQQNNTACVFLPLISSLLVSSQGLCAFSDTVSTHRNLSRTAVLRPHLFRASTWEKTEGEYRQLLTHSLSPYTHALNYNNDIRKKKKKMIGGEYKKERFSERLTAAQNQPRNRGYLPGTQLKTDGYGTGTLMGNWSEERSDAGYYDGKAVVKSGLRAPWTTTYREMVQGAEAASSSASGVPPAVGSLTSATSMTLTAAPCDRSQFSQQTFMDIEDRKQSSYPAHQPHLDPTWQATVQDAHRSTFQTSYVLPEVRRQEVRAFVPPVLGGKPSSQSTGVLLRLRRELELAQEKGEAAAATSAFPGNVIRSVRKAIAESCTDAAGNVNAEELQEGFAVAGINASAAECTALIRYFDEAGNRTAPYAVIVDALRGSMNDRRADLVESVYGHLKNLSEGGVVRLDKLVQWVDVAELPAVKSGAVTAEAARAAFAAQWDARSPTAFISLARFASFFADVAFEVPLDNVFELTLRNMWHFSGGRGSCENTSCRRVEVVHTNGRVTQQEIKNDLLITGSGAAVEPLLRANLAKQGIRDVKSLRVLSLS